MLNYYVRNNHLLFCGTRLAITLRSFTYGLLHINLTFPVPWTQLPIDLDPMFVEWSVNLEQFRVLIYTQFLLHLSMIIIA